MSLLQKRLEQQRKNQIDEESKSKSTKVKTKSKTKNQIWLTIKEKVLIESIKEIDIDEMELMGKDEKNSYVSQKVGKIVDEILIQDELTLTKGENHRLVGEMVSEITGYGPITSLLADNTISEIMVNSSQQIYVERSGKIEPVNVRFRDDNHLIHIIERIVSPLGKRIDESSPMVDARLPDGSRINATVPPITIDGPTLTIRKFSAKPFTVADFISFGTLSTDMAVFIKGCVEGKMNIVVSGGTGSGKTSTLNVLSSHIPNNERIVTIEDAAELNLSQEHVVRMEARAANIEGKGRVSIRDLVINSLRMRPDRIIVGEVRGGEALDMLQAMNTGHDGSITTGHANSPRDLLSRIETMVLMAGIEIPIRAIREQISSAVDIIIQQNRFKDGSRKISKITEVVGMEGDVITLQDIFVFEERGIGENGKVLGNFQATGVIPKCINSLETKGIPVSINIFNNKG